MSRYHHENHIVSRRTFLRRIAWAPVLFLPAPLYAGPFRPLAGSSQNRISSSSGPNDLRFTPQCSAKSPLEDVLRHVIPGADEYITEKYALEIAELLVRDLAGRSIHYHQPALAAPLARKLGDAVDGQIEIVVRCAGAVARHAGESEGLETAVIVYDESYSTE